MIGARFSSSLADAAVRPSQHPRRTAGPSADGRRRSRGTFAAVDLHRGPAPPVVAQRTEKLLRMLPEQALSGVRERRPQNGLPLPDFHVFRASAGPSVGREPLLPLLVHEVLGVRTNSAADAGGLPAPPAACATLLASRDRRSAPRPARRRPSPHGSTPSPAADFRVSGIPPRRSPTPVLPSPGLGRRRARPLVPPRPPARAPPATPGNAIRSGGRRGRATPRSSRRRPSPRPAFGARRSSCAL